jgi:signal transduction histidine kinase
MKRFFLTLFCLVAVSGAVFYVVSVPHERAEIRAKQGILDLRGVDLNDGVTALAGEWEFFWDSFYSPEDFGYADDFNEKEKIYLSVPGSWNDTGLPRTGHGTYRLKLIVEETKNLMLYVPEIRSASVVWVNGEKIHEAGRVGSSKAEEIPRPKNGITELPANEAAAPVIDIVVQVSSYDRFFGGIRNNFRIGTNSALLTWAILRWSASACVAGIFFVAGVYHLMLWLFRRKYRMGKDEIIILVFATTCFVVGIRLFIEKDGLAQYLVHGWGWVNAFINPVSGFLVAFHIVLTFLFTLLVFNLKLSRVMKGVYFALCAALLASSILVPPPLRYRLALLGLVPTGMIIVHTGLTWTRKSFEEQTWLWLYFVAMIFFFIWGPLANTMLEPYFFMPFIFPNAFIMLIQFTMLTNDYAETLHKARWLEEENMLQTKLAEIKNHFLMNMNHEMKTPLATISISAQAAAALLRKGGNADEICSMLEVVQAEAERSARMMKTALTLEMAQSARGGMSELDVGLLLKKTAENYRILVERSGNTLTVGIPELLPRALGNADELSQVLINLITNANRHTKMGEITITANREFKMISVTVSDTGEGIEPETVNGIFERKPVKDQHGLGLSICKEIMDRHGGTIRMESIRGEGTSVTFTLNALGGNTNEQ